MVQGPFNNNNNNTNHLLGVGVGVGAGGGGGVPYSWNDNKVGFSDSDEFRNSYLNDGNDEDGFGANQKRIKLMGSNQQVGRQIDLFGDIEPLGLSLKKTPSFLDLIEAKLAQGTIETTTNPNETNQTCTKSRSRTSDLDSQPISSEKLKASNFTATLLRIGNWERVAKNEGDLVAKCYYAKRKLVWEVLENGLKSKIEIPWSDISAIGASFPEQQPGILELELKRAPQFYRESNPQPRKHTLWHLTSDFTGGQAPIYRRHYLQFPEGTLEKHYEKLLQYDKELLKLSQKPFPFSNSPFFQQDPCEFQQDFYLDFRGNHQKIPPMLQFSHLPIQSPHLVPPYPYPVPKFNQTIRPFVNPNPNDSHSPMSVMDVPFFEENIGYPGIQQHMSPLPIRNDQHFHMAWGNRVPEPPMMVSQTQEGHFIPRLGESNEDLPERGSHHLNNWPLNAVYDQLLNNESDQRLIRLDEQRVLAKVNSMACLLQTVNEQNLPITQNTCINHEEYSYGDNTNNSIESSSTDQSYDNGGDQWAYNNQAVTISWNGNDPFMNVPRTPSFPGLLFNTSMGDFSNVDPESGVNHQWR